MKRLIAFLCLFLLNISLLHAAVTINIVESGGDVVATTSGSVNTDSLIPIGLTHSSSGSYLVGSGRSVPEDSVIGIGPNITARSYRNANLVTDMVFSTISSFTRATSLTGGTADYIAIDSRNDREDRIILSTAYVSNSPINATATWAGATFASLELIPGTYNATWGSGASADSLTIIIGAAPTTHTVGGTFDGHNADITLRNNGGDNLTLTTFDNSFTFDTAVAEGSPYAVTILSQDPNETCSVTNGNGTIGTANVIDVAVTCDPLFQLGGNFSGVTTGGSITLQNNGGDNLVWNENVITSYKFPTRLAQGATYSVTVLTPPVGQICTVDNATGTMSNSNFVDVNVTCVDDVIPTYSVGGNVSGLTGTGLQLQNNGGDTLAVAAAATAFTFATELAAGDSYVVSVSAQPDGQTCSVSADNGTMPAADVTNVAVDCVDDSVIPPPTTPVTSYTGALPSGATGTLSFTSTDAACTFATPPQFLDTVTPAPPASILLVDGVISFTVSGCTPGATVTLTMDYGVALPIGSNFWKAGTPWYRLPATAAGTTVTFSIMDGGLGDTDGLVNGTIVDPSGAATDVAAPVVPVNPIPTLSEWALMILSMLLGLIIFTNRRRLF